MTRTVTGAVGELYDATKLVITAISAIAFRSVNQSVGPTLVVVNSMTESIEKLILKQKEKQRLEGDSQSRRKCRRNCFPGRLRNWNRLKCTVSAARREP